MALCTAIYVVVATLAVGAMSYTLFSKAHEAAPLVYILEALNHGTAAQIVAAAVVIAIPSVILGSDVRTRAASSSSWRATVFCRNASPPSASRVERQC